MTCPTYRKLLCFSAGGAVAFGRVGLLRGAQSAPKGAKFFHPSAKAAPAAKPTPKPALHKNVTWALARYS